MSGAMDHTLACQVDGKYYCTCDKKEAAVRDPLETAIHTGTREEWDRYIKWLQDGRPELKTADEWSAIKGISIKDPDGWRTDDAPDYENGRITEEEFIDRANRCTIQILPGSTFCG